jgi:hypothetical protein
MTDYPRALSQPEQIRSLQEQMRRLRTRIPPRQEWPWYSLRPYLCGGWIDAFSDNPYRQFAVADGEDPGDKAGFYDTGQILIFTGTLAWNPEGWWPTPDWEGDTGDPVLQGNPEVYKDGGAIIQSVDGLGHTPLTVSADDDLGYPLPYVPSEPGAYSLAWPTSDSYHFGSAEPWTDGAHLDVTPTYRESDPVGTVFVFYSLVGNGGHVTDPAGFTHHKPPAGAVAYNLAGSIMRYTTALETPTGYASAPRTQDAYFGVNALTAYA